jgi:archaetidylinositol phosphate synthase
MSHVREHRSLLAPAEKRLLMAIATRLPAWVHSDHLTLLGLASMPIAGLGFAWIATARWSAPTVAIALLVNWFGDSLDGTLARVRGQERPRYGFYVDHVLDLVGTSALFVGMASSGQMQPAIALAALAAYLMVSAETYLATYASSMFRLSFAGIGPTELRLLIAGGALYVARHPSVNLAGTRVHLLDISGVCAAAALTVVFVVSAMRTSRALYRAEPLPRPVPALRLLNRDAAHDRVAPIVPHARVRQRHGGAR